MSMQTNWDQNERKQHRRTACGDYKRNKENFPECWKLKKMITSKKDDANKEAKDFGRFAKSNLN